MATSEIDEMSMETARFWQRLKQAAAILANRPGGLSRREKQMLLQQIRYQHRLEAFEQARARDWYSGRVEDYRAQRAHVTALAKLGQLDPQQRQSAHAYLAGIRESVESSVHATMLNLTERGQVVQALDRVDRDPTRQREVFGQINGHDAIRARWAGAQSEQQQLVREYATRSVLDQVNGRDRIARGEVTDLDVARTQRRTAAMRDYFEVHSDEHAAELLASQRQPWQPAAATVSEELAAAQDIPEWSATVTGRFVPNTDRDTARMAGFADRGEAIGWMRTQLHDSGIERAAVELRHREGGIDFRFDSGPTTAILGRLAAIANHHHGRQRQPAEHAGANTSADQAAGLHAQIDQLEADNRRLTGERDEAVQKLIAVTPAHQRYGSRARNGKATPPAAEQVAETVQDHDGPVRSH